MNCLGKGEIHWFIESEDKSSKLWEAGEGESVPEEGVREGLSRQLHRCPLGIKPRSSDSVCCSFYYHSIAAITTNLIFFFKKNLILTYTVLSVFGKSDMCSKKKKKEIKEGKNAS